MLVVVASAILVVASLLIVRSRDPEPSPVATPGAALSDPPSVDPTPMPPVPVDPTPLARTPIRAEPAVWALGAGMTERRPLPRAVEVVEGGDPVERWRYALPGGVPSGGGVVGSTWYVVTGQPGSWQVHAVDLTTGTARWIVDRADQVASLQATATATAIVLTSSDSQGPYSGPGSSATVVPSPQVLAGLRPEDGKATFERTYPAGRPLLAGANLDGSILVQQREGFGGRVQRIEVVEAADGAIRWGLDLQENTGVFRGTDQVYLLAGGTLSAHAVEDGRVRWRLPRGAAVAGCWGDTGVVVLCKEGGGSGSGDGGAALVARSVDDGTVRWSRVSPRGPGEKDASDSVGVAPDGSVLVGRSTIVALDIGDGTERFRSSPSTKASAAGSTDGAGAMSAGPLVISGPEPRLVLPAVGGLVVVDAATGATTATIEAIVLNAHAWSVADGVLVAVVSPRLPAFTPSAASGSGQVGVVGFDLDTGRARWAFAPGHRTLAYAYDGGVMIVADDALVGYG